MKKPSRYRVGSVFLYNQGHDMFGGVVVKVAPNKWMKMNYKTKVRQFYTNNTVENLFTANLLTLVQDAGKVES